MRSAEVDGPEIATLMTCRLAREVRNGDVVGVGLGTPLALAAALLARATDAPKADVIVGGGRVTRTPISPPACAAPARSPGGRRATPRTL